MTAEKEAGCSILVLQSVLFCNVLFGRCWFFVTILTHGACSAVTAAGRFSLLFVFDHTANYHRHDQNKEDRHYDRSKII